MLFCWSWLYCCLIVPLSLLSAWYLVQLVASGGDTVDAAGVQQLFESNGSSVSAEDSKRLLGRWQAIAGETSEAELSEGEWFGILHDYAIHGVFLAPFAFGSFF